MLDPEEQDRIAEQFGVDGAQVLRDHLISHVLAALGAEAPDGIVFFGGTALARSIMIEGRLSEDVDLIAVGSRGKVAEHLTNAIPRTLRREFPGLRWSPSLVGGRDSEAAILHTTDGIAVRIQLLDAVGYPRWPTERVALTQRYSDAPPATLTVLTPAGFVAAKTSAWHDRAAPRDLWDLWALAEHGHLTAAAADLFARLGPDEPATRSRSVRRSSRRDSVAPRSRRSGAADRHGRRSLPDRPGTLVRTRAGRRIAATLITRCRSASARRR